MNFWRSAALGSFVLALVAADAALAVTYKATLLHPMSGFTHTFGLGVSGISQVGTGYGMAAGGSHHALLWNGTADSVIDLHPEGFSNSEATAAALENQVGWGQVSGTGEYHALLWSGNPQSAVDLTPAGFNHALAFGAFDNRQVGYASKPNQASHAMLWSGTAESAIDLHPSAYIASLATAVSGNTQVGASSNGDPDNIENEHALLWRGTADSVVNLNPAGFLRSTATDVSGETQVGFGYSASTGFNDHALLWTGSAESVVDLHPHGFTSSRALSNSEIFQVGIGSIIAGVDHALLWNGSADSVLDLHMFLGDLSVTLISSGAQSVDNNGKIVGYGEGSSGNFYAVLWTAVPEPNMWATLWSGLIIAAYRAPARRSYL